MNKSVLMREIAVFRKSREVANKEAKIGGCLTRLTFSGTGDLTRSTFTELAEMQRNLKRSLARERIRGVARHQLYNLNRHIDLKRALDAVQAAAHIKRTRRAVTVIE